MFRLRIFALVGVRSRFGVLAGAGICGGGEDGYGRSAD